ncbi:YcaO-like family protein [Actinomadura madurae]|uniref:YcaO-like family protein n=1 Tax=Actinomadura madurae TaxID=1993 RepID=UPI0020D23E5B|nr:YcaO-like family protein [Actinomadura madurae]MCP9951111.1 YcaO-like family protein [Actinomadura madurae]
MRKTFRGGTDRAVALEESLARATALAEVAGITRLADITGLDRLGMPVHTAIRPAARSLAASQGKGLLPEAAKVSALMESLELWHAETHHLPFRFDSAADLRAAGEAVAEVEDLVHCACGKFRPGLPMRWVLGHDLPSGTATWVPYEVVHCDWRLPEVYGEHAFVNGSNGLASGNTLIEATVHGLCEVMERDAVAAFEDLGEAGEADRRVRADSVGDPDCRALLDLLRASGVESVIFDCTSDLGLATFVCWMVEVDPPWYHPLPQAQGAGAHPRREIALLRALTEAAQARASVIAGLPRRHRLGALPVVLRPAGARGHRGHAGASRAAGLRGRSARRPRDVQRGPGLAPRTAGQGGRPAGHRRRPHHGGHRPAGGEGRRPRAAVAAVRRRRGGPGTVVFAGPSLPAATARALLPRADVRPPGRARGRAGRRPGRRGRRGAGRRLLRAGAGRLAQGADVRAVARRAAVRRRQHGRAARRRAASLRHDRGR